MAGPRRSGPKPAGRPGRPARSGRDGGVGSWRLGLGHVAIALGILAIGIALLFTHSPSQPPAPVPVAALPRVPAAPSSVSASPWPAAEPSGVPVDMVASAPLPARAAGTSFARAAMPQVPRLRDPQGDQTPDIADYINPGENPTMAEVIDRLNRAGVYGGLGAFSPPGTRPPMVGLAVPEDFVLPPGYMRHYQATDDGQRIEPVLMFTPDSPYLDPARRSSSVPVDRLVPPELAPPGLPIRQVVIPASSEPAK